MRIFVTGGAGFIGSNFVHYMLEKYDDIEIVVYDKLTYAGNLDNLKDVEDDPRYRFVRGDICDSESVEKHAKDMDWIVNFAAETHVDRSIKYAKDFIMTDVYGTYVLLECARHMDIRFLQISTDEVYGEAHDEPCSEDAPLNPKSPYAASKAGGDRLAYAYYETYGLPTIITRCTNNYGPYQFPEKLIPKFVTNVLRNIPLPVYGDGKNTRDWIHVRDHCKALDLLMMTKGYYGHVFNIGAGEEHSVLEIAEIILNELGKSKKMIKFIDDRPGHVRRHAVSTRKIREATGWKAETPFDEGIRKTIKWYVDNVWWWRPLLRRVEF